MRERPTLHSTGPARQAAQSGEFQRWAPPMSLMAETIPQMRDATFVVALATFACFGFSARAAQGPAEASPSQICNAEGAFGIHFSDKSSGTQVPKRTAFFGQGCYQVSPPVTHPSFDTYAACVSEFDGTVFMIQALKVFDDQPPQGSRSLTSAQMESNRKRGQQVLDGLLAEFPPEVRATVKVTDAVRMWELSLDGDARLEVSNFVGWAVSLECRNEAKAQKVFRQRVHGNR